MSGARAKRGGSTAMTTRTKAGRQEASFDATVRQTKGRLWFRVCKWDQDDAAIQVGRGPCRVTITPLPRKGTRTVPKRIRKAKEAR